MKPEVVLWL